MGLIALAALIYLLATIGEDQKDEPRPVPPPVAPSQPEPEAIVERIQCPVCLGYGYSVEQTRAGPRRRICQFCAGKGGKVLRIPPGNVKCPNCEGFGKIRTSAAASAMCLRCAGRGYIKAPFEPSS